ncbi:DNA repair protein XRCC4 [Naviculisporaceae sp. PSN 640]
MGGSSQIIRIPRTDEAGKDGSHVLGEVTATGGASKPLNVKIVATEGDAPYTVKIKHDRIGDLRVSSSSCSPDEWEDILTAILLNGKHVEGVEAGAEVESEKSITITIRRWVAGISQRLGSITLSYKEKEAIELFDWCDTALQEREKLKKDVEKEASKAADLEARVTELKNQLDELIQAKKDREKEILEKMCRLLNEKKVKIRQQQRLLNSAKIDPDTKMEDDHDDDDDDDDDDKAAVRHVPTASRPNKRKNRRGQADEDDDSSGDGFEKMDVDPTPSSPKVDQGSPDERHTPEMNDEDDEDVTGSEPDDDDDEPPVSPPKHKRAVRKTTPAAAKASAQKGKGKAKVADSVAMHTRRREASTPPVATPADEEETESDDEL